MTISVRGTAVLDGARARLPADAYDARALLGGKALRRIDRLSELGVYVSALAMQRAGLWPLPCEPERIGVFFATGQGNFSGTMGYLERLHDKGAKLASPIEFPNLVMSAASGTLSMAFGCKGEILAVSERHTAGSRALVLAFEALRAGRLDHALVCGVEELSPAREKCAALTRGSAFGLGEGAAAMLLSRDGEAPVQLTHAAMTGRATAEAAHRLVSAMRVPRADLALGPKALAYALGEAHADPADRSGELDVLGLLAAVMAAETLTARDAGSVLCVDAHRDAGCNVLRFERSLGRREEAT